MKQIVLFPDANMLMQYSRFSKGPYVQQHLNLQSLRSRDSSTSLTSVLILYSVLFWGNSEGALRVFKMQKMAIRLLSGSGQRIMWATFQKVSYSSTFLLFIIQCLLFVKSNFLSFQETIITNTSLEIQKSFSENSQYISVQKCIIAPSTL